MLCGVTVLETVSWNSGDRFAACKEVRMGRVESIEEGGVGEITSSRHWHGLSTLDRGVTVVCVVIEGSVDFRGTFWNM